MDIVNKPFFAIGEIVPLERGAVIPPQFLIKDGSTARIPLQHERHTLKRFKPGYSPLYQFKEE